MLFVLYGEKLIILCHCSLISLAVHDCVHYSVLVLLKVTLHIHVFGYDVCSKCGMLIISELYFIDSCVMDGVVMSPPHGLSLMVMLPGQDFCRHHNIPLQEYHFSAPLVLGKCQRGGGGGGGVQQGVS